MYKKGAGNDKQVKDAGNRTLCPYRNFSQVIMWKTDENIVLMRKFQSRYPELASRFNKSPSSMICDSAPMAQLYHTFAQS